MRKGHTGDSGPRGLPGPKGDLGEPGLDGIDVSDFSQVNVFRYVCCSVDRLSVSPHNAKEFLINKRP